MRQSSTHVAKAVLLLLNGASAGIAFVPSCGDNWYFGFDAAVDVPQVTDAAAGCDCPAVEPPLAGRFEVVNAFQIIPGNDISGQGRVCPIGSYVISGSCTIDPPNPMWRMTIQQSGFVDLPLSAWHCLVRNNEPTPVRLRVDVICLRPAS